MAKRCSPVIAIMAVLGSGITAAGEAQPVLYHHPEAAGVAVRHELIEGRDLELDLYYPPRFSGSGSPAVVFVFAYPDSGAHGPLRRREPYPSWARLVAAEGFVGILYETNSPGEDLHAVMGHLKRHAARFSIDPQRVALWSASGNTALALKYARVHSSITPAAVVAYYGVMPTPDQHQAAAFDSIRRRFGFVLPGHGSTEVYRKDLPILIVRAGRDSWREILSSIDHFTEYALKENLAVTVRNYPDGQHAFDILDDTSETRAVIRGTLDFLHRNLSTTSNAGKVQPNGGVKLSSR